ncbi:hypothetical protein [Sphingomonas sp. RB1R13]|uniref:hypothetical protein n=1 Tax=Sphingomonas sp. RB1R13 TaxID=3096159 RepID=UPI002FC7DBFD
MPADRAPPAPAAASRICASAAAAAARDDDMPRWRGHCGGRDVSDAAAAATPGPAGADG